MSHIRASASPLFCPVVDKVSWQFSITHMICHKNSMLTLIVYCKYYLHFTRKKRNFVCNLDLIVNKLVKQAFTIATNDSSYINGVSLKQIIVRNRASCPQKSHSYWYYSPNDIWVFPFYFLLLKVSYVISPLHKQGGHSKSKPWIEFGHLDIQYRE